MSTAAKPVAVAPASRERTAMARRLLLDAVVLGGLADAFLHDGFGIGLFAWMIIFAATFVHIKRRQGALSREQTGWLVAALFFAGTFGIRDSGTLGFYDFVAMLSALALLGATSSAASPVRSVLGQRVRDLAHVLARSAAMVAAAVLLLLGACGLGSGVQEWNSGRAKSVVRATLIALPLLLVFGVLLGSADPVFGALFKLPNIDLGTVMSHLLLAGFFTWVVGGWLYGAVLNDKPSPRLTDGMPITLGSLDITIVLGALVALFGLFVGVQIGWLFGGERLVRATTGLGYAQYARHGFFELVWVSLLVLPVLLASRSALRDEDATAVRRHRLLSVPIVALVGGIMVSAFGRMALYVHYYGLSMDRLFATVFMCWLAIVFAWFGLTVLRGRPRDFAAGMTITGFLTLAGLGLVNPEALVARVNVSRANAALTIGDSLNTAATAQSTSAAVSAASPIDYSYLTSRLGGDAVRQVVAALVAKPVSPLGSATRAAEVKSRCEAARRLLGRYGTGQFGWNFQGYDNDWRRWNAGAWDARRVMHDNEQALRAVTCLDSSGEVPFGDRERRPARPGEQGYVEPGTH
jgi:hypothetical protein